MALFHDRAAARRRFLPELFAFGLTHQQIAKVFGVSKHTVDSDRRGGIENGAPGGTSPRLQYSAIFKAYTSQAFLSRTDIDPAVATGITLVLESALDLELVQNIGDELCHRIRSTDPSKYPKSTAHIRRMLHTMVDERIATRQIAIAPFMAITLLENAVWDNNGPLPTNPYELAEQLAMPYAFWAYGIEEAIENALTDRQQSVIEHRFPTDGSVPKKLSDIGVLLGLRSGHTRALQLEQKALAKINAWIRTNHHL